MKVIDKIIKRRRNDRIKGLLKLKNDSAVICSKYAEEESEDDLES